MIFYAADRIHDGFRFVPTEKILAFEDDGTFVEMLDAATVSYERVQRLPGTLMPGMVNAHCHLELSHTKGLIPEHTGLVTFLGKVVSSRAGNETERAELIKEALQALENSGCIAVGDISNGTDTLALRKDANMHFHTFVETMGFVPESAAQRFKYSEQILQQFAASDQNTKGYKMRQSIVPHAPYSVSPQLFELINNYDAPSLISIHNEECAAENEYFKTKTGNMRALYDVLRISDDWFVPTGKNSVPSYLPQISDEHALLLVHNTCMEAADLEALRQRKMNISICLCPNANLYIENQLPDVKMLTQSEFNICLGTDSLASNQQLNVYEEVLCLQKHFPEIEEERLLAWASSGGAKALQMEDFIGSFQQGTKPGLVQLHQGVSKRMF